MTNQPIGLIGAGHMTASLVSGLVAAGYTASAITVSDKNVEKIRTLESRFGVQGRNSNTDVVSHCQALIIAVRPQQVATLAHEIKDTVLQKKPLLISLAAGVGLSFLEHHFSSTIPMVRAMPNTPALVGASITALYGNTHCQQPHKSQTESLMRAIGETLWLNEESQFDIITPLSGSGPVYFLKLMQALIASAVTNGLPEKEALLLTLQTAVGSAKMAIESEIPLATLISEIASKRGVTEQIALKLDDAHFNELIDHALNAGMIRCKEIQALIEQGE